MTKRSNNPARWIALLRAINVGGRTVKMDRLRELFVDLGLDDVSTFIASGNVLFTAKGERAALEKKIERGLNDALGFAVDTFLRTPDELAEVVEGHPFEADPPALQVGFLKEIPSPAATERLVALATEVDRIAVVGPTIYWRFATKRTSESTLSGASFEKALGAPATFRNITTVRKLAAKG